MEGGRGIAISVAYAIVAAEGVITISALDNLAKGASGGAVQALNVALGIDETSGLDRIGVAP